jgi:hypothetical protein
MEHRHIAGTGLIVTLVQRKLMTDQEPTVETASARTLITSLVFVTCSDKFFCYPDQNYYSRAAPVGYDKLNSGFIYPEMARVKMHSHRMTQHERINRL